MHLDFERELSENTVREIHVGQGGAQVYVLTGERIAKQIRRDQMPDEQRFLSYLREAQFYQETADAGLGFLPEVLHCRITSDEIELILRQYQTIPVQTLQAISPDRIMETLAAIHQMPCPSCVPRIERTPVQFTEAELSEALSGWQSILEEHPGVFSGHVLRELAESINKQNAAHFSGRMVCCHGDFHLDNLLTDRDGRIIVCDWQAVSWGHPAGDLSFFLSRLSDTGYAVDPDAWIAAYCRHADGDLSEQEIREQMALANWNTTFRFWHYFLHGAEEARVKGIYEKMLADYSLLQV
ncbi:MAG: aminoglycoside phosphotransferase family protein [Ruminococcaceae bacterium]|nr:aminoglycoside phosphotransferase family protein [Oscillospiraceae bacterium]